MSQGVPYLPEHAPPPQPPAPPPKSTAKTLFLWVILIVGFLTIWQFLTPSDKNPPPPPKCLAPCIEPSHPIWSLVPIVLAIAFVVVCYALFMRRFRGSLSFNAEQEPAFRAIAQRRFGEAASLFRALATKYEKQPAYRAVVDLGIADAELWAGNLDAAIASTVAVDRTSTLGVDTGARVIAAAELSFVYALAGDLEAASRWRDEARGRLSKTNDSRMLTASKLRLTDAVLACRQGRPRDAIALLDEVWLELRFSFIANWMRVAEVIRAFAEAQGDVREQNVVAGRLVSVEPVVGNELAFLGRKWPEMHAFLAAHGFSRPEA